MSETTTYYQDERATVTNSRVILDQSTYPLSNIASVSLYTIHHKKPQWIFLCILGLLVASVGFTLSADNSINFLAGIGIVIIIVCGILAFTDRIKYAVRLGETNALVSTDKAQILRIVDAINQAIIERG